ncbi:host specificity protein J, partial [Pseudomonas aeruginosa]
MGADVQQHLTGRKGGSSKPKQPSIARDSLQSVATAKLLLAVGEGEFAEGPSDQDIYLDNTPLMDASGNVNFPNVKWEWRSGSVDQDYIPGIPSVENETTVNVELRSDTPWVRSVTNAQLSAVRLRFAWPALQKQESSGDVTGYRIEYAVDVSTDGGAYQQVLLDAVDGKTTSRYERSQRIDLPAATTGWQVRVRRITPNQNSSLIADTMLIAGLTEVIDAKLRYPNTALLYIEFSAEQFSNIPAVTVECKARKVQVPTTYDPELRTYTGVWDGSFKSAWTNNPAWITYDISTNARFGLGKRIKPWMVDKWELYKIAQYCDQLVPDGKGGQEPRFLCDLNLQSRSQAWTLLRDIAAIYRGMSYWAQGQLVSQADMPRTADFDYVFTRANVIDGKMTYGAASARTRYSRALVSYDNPANNYDTDVTGYSDAPLLRRYGDNPVELSAIGCTRESEAQRRGKWAVLTSVQDRTITFATGMEGRIPLPGYIIPVADSLLAGREIGGRISAVAGRVVTLDRVTQAKAGDRLIINLPSGRAEGRTVQSVNGKAVTVTAAYSETPEPELCWALDADDLAVQLYRVMSTKRDDNGQWTINGLQYEPSKFDHIDTGARLEERPISIIPVTTVQPPASVTLSSRWTIDQGLAVSTMTITWPAVEGAVAYDVEWKKDSGNWIRLPRAGTTSVDVTGIYAGGYLARVRAVSAFDITSVWKSSILTQLSGKTGAPPALAFLRTTSGPWKIGLEWGFPASGAADTAYTEIQQSVTPGGSEQNATALGLFAYPTDTHTLTSLAAGARLAFRGRLIDRTGNVGPWSTWVDGISSTDASEYNELITKEYVESALGEQFFADIDQMQVDISGLQDQIDNLTDVLAYDPTKTYAKNDIVRVGNRLYQAKQAVPLNASPPNATYWADIGQSIETANGLAQQVATNTADITELDGKVEAAASSLDVLQAAARREPATGEKADALKGWDTIARAATEVTVRANEDEAQAKRTSLLEARTGTAEGRIATVESVVASNNAVTVQRLDQLSGQVASNASAISTEQTVRANADSALGQRVDTVSARTDTNEANIQTTSQAVTSLDGNVKALYSV